VRNFHEGEAQMQGDAGIDTAAFDAAVNQSYVPDLKPNEVEFVTNLTFGVATSMDSDGRPWTSPLFGARRQLFNVESPTTVRVRPVVSDGDPLLANVGSTRELGVLYFDPSQRRRAKSLGSGSVLPDGSIRYEMTRNFGLCPKYIFKRSHEHIEHSNRSDMPNTTDVRLSDTDQQQLARADTVFVGSFHDGHGADASHRGGPPGFVDVADETTVRIPDYPGNDMFNTLGNLQLNPRLSLLSVDFSTGRTIQLTGIATIDRAPADAQELRTLTLSIAEVQVTWAHVGTWHDLEPYPRYPQPNTQPGERREH
jgi:uncharacterized protein